MRLVLLRPANYDFVAQVPGRWPHRPDPEEAFRKTENGWMRTHLHRMQGSTG